MSESCILGSAFGGLEGTLEGVDVADGAPAAAILTAVDARRGGLADDERLVFMLGYEACVGLDPRAGHNAHFHPHDPKLGPATLLRRLRLGATPPRAAAVSSTVPTLTTSTERRQAHLERLRRCRESLHDGVIYQANLSHRLAVSETSRDDALAFYLARKDRAACAAFLDVDGFGSIVSLSPERFVAADLVGKRAWTWPIKGTVRRPAGNEASSDDDRAALERLQASAKDRAEHVMIVDLLRNDLGRVAVVSGVTVESLMHVVSTASVHHLESRISATLRDDVGVAALLRATIPGGSITGAPKSSAVDVIAELEDGPRGAYTGVLGVVDSRGQLMTSLLIRTWLRPDIGPGALHVGGGIVVDSDPEAEWDETLHKAAAFGEVVISDEPSSSATTPDRQGCPGQGFAAR